MDRLLSAMNSSRKLGSFLRSFYLTPARLPEFTMHPTLIFHAPTLLASTTLKSGVPESRFPAAIAGHTTWLFRVRSILKDSLNTLHLSNIPELYLEVLGSRGTV